MAAQQLGRGRCPLCGDTNARVSLSKNGYAVLTCAANGCGLQLFTRGEGADEKVRDLIGTPAPAPAPAADPAPAPAAAPWAWGSAPAPAPKPEEKPAGDGFKWGLGSWSN
jgi:hypothetical protein